MSLNLVISVDEAKARMSLPSDQLGVTPGVESAIRAAQLWAEGVLDTSLEYRKYEDTFHLDPETFMDVTPGGMMRMQLRSGLVRTDMRVKAYTGRTWDTCTDEINLAGARIDHDRGILSVSRVGNQGLFCRVVYTAGFEQGDDIPEWLTEALLAYIPLAWNFAQPANRSEEAEVQARMSAQHAATVLSRYHRNIGFTYRPVF